MAQSIASRSQNATESAAHLVDGVWVAMKGRVEKLVASLSADSSQSLSWFSRKRWPNWFESWLE